MTIRNSSDELFEFVVEMEVAFARAQVEAGADLIGIGDAAASLIGPKLYDRFVLPYEKKLVTAIKAMGARVRLHICGNTRKILGGMGSLGCDIVDLDFLSPMAEGRAAMGPGQVLLGNIDPVRALRDGTPESITGMLAECYAGRRASVHRGGRLRGAAGNAARKPEGPDRLRQEPPAVTAAGPSTPTRADRGASPARPALRAGSRVPLRRGLAVRRLQGPGPRRRRADHRRDARGAHARGARGRLAAGMHGRGGRSASSLEIAQWSIAVLDDRADVPFEPADGLGAVVDIGTTTLVAQLVDRRTGAVLKVETALNPQARFGADLMSRIRHDLAEPGT